MRKESARVIEMKKNFMNHQKDGKSISEIADIYNLSTKAVYYHLQGIADKNGVSRKELLERDYPETRNSPSIVVSHSKNDFEEEEYISLKDETISYMDSKINEILVFLDNTGGK